jgi:radical SAM protein with 4Fe4S-binding SPASM domain
MSKFGPSSNLDPSKAEHNVSRIEEIGLSSIAYKRRFSDGTPYFTSVEFSITDLCNRTCVFCPRHDPSVYPNNNSEISVELYTKIMRELVELEWQGLVSFSGFGEPLLHTQYGELIKITRSHLPDSIIEMVSNGDRLSLETASAIFEAGLDCIKVSLYDGPHQIEPFEKLRSDLGLDQNQFIIRHRFLGPEENFGLILTNRAGMVSFDKLPIKPLEKESAGQCFFPFNKITIDYDGRVLLCPHDWNKEWSGGDLNTQSLEEIWSGEILQKTRRQLARGSRCSKPCSACDVDGTLNGRDTFEKWLEVFPQE